ncbi:glycosyltransferase family 2 protein [Neisseria meningitidis]|uniref:glycosyltransferase family 2 protein n=1 Tax=Neisseria meningitidis TaxID=487 RepID=UPI001F0C217A|nr:glycosyltransferase [Neisseria meningitidis]
MIFSIIVPIYNVEKYLRCCVDSVLAENFADYEMILVDDGSPDGCGKICDEYTGKYPHIKVIHQENGGLSDARNAGIRAAKGDYLIFLDSDDYWADTNRSKNAGGGGFSLIYNNLQTKRLI